MYGAVSPQAPQAYGQVPPQGYAQAQPVYGGAPAQTYGQVPAQTYGQVPTQTYGQIPTQAYGQIPAQPAYGAVPYGQSGLPTTPPYPGYPGYQQGPWPEPGLGQTPTKKKSWLPTLIVVVAVFVIAGPLISSLMSAEPEPAPRPNPPVYTPTPTSGPTSSTSTTPSGGYTPGPPDLTPDDPPFPKTDSQIDQILDSSPLYSQSLVPTNCEISTIDLAHAPVADIEAYMNQFVDCLMAAWYTPVANAGFSLPHPSVTVYTQEISSACGQLPMYNAAYCTADQQIYYAQNLIQAFPSSIQAMRFLAESIIAHEFGHAVQYRTMILASEEYREYDALTDDEAMDYSRRLEMQADCLAGSFFNSVATSTNLTSTDEDNIARIFTVLGGTVPYDDDHGMGVNRAYWVEEGLHDWSVGVCNTFTASPDQVS